MLLVTGKAGFLGQYVEGFGVDDMSRGTNPVDCKMDIRDGALWRYMQGVECVVHLAGFKDAEESYREPEEYWNRNVYGTMALVATMKGVCNKMVFASSAAVKGPSPYGLTKLVCEKFLLSVPWLKVGILRIHNPVGKGCSGLFKSLQSGSVAIRGNGARDYVAADEVGEAIRLATTRLDQSFVVDIGTGVATRTEDVVALWKKPLNITRHPGPEDTYRADTSHAEKILGWKARKSVADIIAEL